MSIQLVPASSRHRALARVICVASLLAIASLTLLPSSQHVPSNPLCIVCGSTGAVDVTLNVLLFVPLGAGLALAGIPPRRAIPAMCALTTIIEAMQLWIVPGRDASIGDVFSNSLGGIAGFAVGASLGVLLFPAARRARMLSIAWLSLWCGMQVVASLMIRARPTDGPYYGQIRRAFGDHAVFPGRVFGATLDGAAVPNTRFGDSRTARDALASDTGATLDVHVIPRRTTSRTAPILRIADAEEEELLELGARNGDAIYGVRTGADALHFRPLLLLLTGGVTPGADTVSLRARWGAKTALLSRATTSETRAVRARVSPGVAWRFAFPRQTYLHGGTRDEIANATWVALMLLPAGYWLRIAAGERTDRRTTAVVAALSLVLSMSVIPALVGVSAASPTEIAGALAGLLAGALCALMARRSNQPARAAPGVGEA